MDISVQPARLEHISLWRDMYRAEMDCCGRRAVEGIADRLRVLRRPQQRLCLFELFQAFLEVSNAVSIEVQSNDAR